MVVFPARPSGFHEKEHPAFRRDVLRLFLFLLCHIIGVDGIPEHIEPVVEEFQHEIQQHIDKIIANLTDAGVTLRI